MHQLGHKPQSLGQCWGSYWKKVVHYTFLVTTSHANMTKNRDPWKNTLCCSMIIMLHSKSIKRKYNTHFHVHTLHFKRFAFILCAYITHYYSHTVDVSGILSFKLAAFLLWISLQQWLLNQKLCHMIEKESDTEIYCSKLIHSCSLTIYFSHIAGMFISRHVY